MTKKYAMIVIAILVVVVCSVIIMNVGMSGAATQEKEVAKIGNYPLTESALKEYVLLAGINTTSVDSVKSLEAVAKDYAKARIAAEEIAGTQYEVSSEQRKKFLAQGNKNAQRDKESNSDFCKKYGISQEELTNAVVNSKMDIMIVSNHFSWFMDKLKENDKQQGREHEYATGERVSLYEEYMEKKVAEMEFVILDEKSVNDVQVFLDSILEKAEK